MIFIFKKGALKVVIQVFRMQMRMLLEIFGA